MPFTLHLELNLGGRHSIPPSAVNQLGPRSPTLMSQTWWIPHGYKTAEISMTQLVRSVFNANTMHKTGLLPFTLWLMADKSQLLVPTIPLSSGSKVFDATLCSSLPFNCDGFPPSKRCWYILRLQIDSADGQNMKWCALTTNFHSVLEWWTDLDGGHICLIWSGLGDLTDNCSTI